MEIRIAVRRPDFRRVNVVEPIIGDHFAGNVENESPQAVTLIGIGIHAPVTLVKVLIDGTFHVNPTLFDVPRRRTLLTIDDVASQRHKVPGLKKGVLNGILHPLNVGRGAV